MKDPAVLFYISDWLTSTSEMDSDARGWYLNLLLHNYDKGSLPNDVEKLAVLAGVKFSEYKRFEQVFEQVFKHKFEQTPEQRLSNPRTNEILRHRENYKEKRSQSGKLSYFLKFCRAKYSKSMNKAFVEFIKDNADFNGIDLKNEQMLEHLFEHLFELYRNENENKNKDKNSFIIPTEKEISDYCLERKNKVDAAKFFDFYTSKGWMVGRNKMKDWKAAVRTWENSEKNNTKNGTFELSRDGSYD